jgi:hypothetical protein
MRTGKLGMMGLALLCGFMLSGCTPRFRGWDSFESSTRPYQVPLPDDPAWERVQGDPYTRAGVLGASGGTIQNRHLNRPRRGQLDPTVDPNLVRPMKGTGQMPGETPVSGRFGPTNAPMFQPLPGEVSPVVGTTEFR